MNGPVPAWRSALLGRVVAQIETEIRQAWESLLCDLDVAAGSAGAIELAWLVVDDPAAYGWRTVDGALDQLTCPACGSRLTRGPESCETCEFHHRMRFGAREVDRRHVPPGNEHALRVASAVTRTRHRYSPRARVGYELVLPELVAGALPTTRQAQAGKALINKLTDDECDRVTDLAQVEELAAGR
ncbi:hypothetical protein [Micromonospora peucetia]|uniref:Uncharacterized protein n=1 Tax=Micromonospora peucetia TaxID=47871 RepID=A0A1C6VKA3_9ACTN|nr:hypothetical protein [Micromonospora peucetia]WSA30423.1 hypothetical protein OIE14_19730 [Micromonospora peucetia]SCL66340.1 hypothetical protein GA0070608_3271 [Micromonospora peucetia]